MADTTPAPGTTRYLCPLECGWHYDEPPPNMNDFAGITPEPGVDGPDEATHSVARQAYERKARWTEEALRDHLATHTSEEDVRAIRALLAASGAQPDLGSSA